MRNRGIFTALVLVVLSFTGAFDSIGQSVGLSLGPSQAHAAPSKLVIPAAMGFSGTLLGEVGHNDDGKVLDAKWLVFRIKLIKVVSFDKRNIVRLSREALTAQWKDNFVSIGPASGAAPLPELAGGDLVLVTGFQVEGHVRQTRTITFKQGEDEPNGYTFLKKIENGTKVSVALRKMGQNKTFSLAMEKDAVDKMPLSADLLTAVDGLKENTVVLVTLDRNNVLKTIKPYQSPEKGEFIKVIAEKANGKTMYGLQIKDASGVTKVVSFSVQNTADLERTARALKPGAAVIYRTVTDDVGPWMTELHRSQ